MTDNSKTDDRKVTTVRVSKPDWTDTKGRTTRMETSVQAYFALLINKGAEALGEPIRIEDALSEDVLRAYQASLCAAPQPARSGTVAPRPRKRTRSGEIAGLVERLWSVAPMIARQRSSRREVERELLAPVKRGHAPANIIAGVIAYFASPEATQNGGVYAKGIHRVIEHDRWLSFIDNSSAGFLEAAE